MGEGGQKRRARIFDASLLITLNFPGEYSANFRPPCPDELKHAFGVPKVLVELGDAIDKGRLLECLRLLAVGSYDPSPRA